MARQLSGDLDNIVLMAIRPEPDRRYSSVEQLSSDVERYLQGMPVHARQGTLVYRAGKFARRHRLGIAAGALAGCTLIGGVIASAHQAATAQRRFEQVHKLANKFLFDFDDRIQALTGATSARELMVRTALQYLDSLRSDSGDDPMLEWELAVAYERVGDVQGNPTMANLGQPAAALESYRKALDLEQTLAQRDWISLGRAAVDRRRVLRSLSMLHYKSGDLLEQKGATPEALQTFQKGLDIAQSLFAHEPREPEDFQLLGMGHQRIGDIALKQSKAQQARESFRHASEAFEQWAALQPDNRSRRFVAFSYSNLGRVLMDSGDVAGSLENYRRALEICEDLARREPANAIYRRDLMGAYMSVGDMLGSPAYFNMGDPAGAIDAYGKGLALAERLAAEDPRNVLARRDLTNSLRRMANLQRDSDPAGAAERYRQSMAITEGLLKLDPQNSEWRRLHALNELQFGYALFKSGDRAAANRLLQSALETQRSLSETDSTRTTYSQDLVTTYHFLGDLYLASNDEPLALATHVQALTLSNELVSRSPFDFYALFCLGDSYERLGRDHAAIARRRGPGPTTKSRWQTARDYYAKGLDTWTEWDRRGASNPFNLRRKNQLAAAIAECDRALAGLRR
ncbi:MAG: tetratricopeptide repeat protein [Bryobacteraceae bacterium]